MAIPVPQNAVAVGNADVDLLGRLATFTFPDDPLPAAKVVRKWAEHGLDVNDLPDVRNATHLFQSACRSVETKRRDSSHGVEVKVDEVVNNAQECIYQITRLVRDKANKVIEHPKAMTLSLDKRTDTVTCRELEDYKALRPLEDAIRQHFAKHAKDLPGQKIRNSVRATLEKIGGQNLRGKAGGLYFIPDTFRSADSQGRTVEFNSVDVLGRHDAPAGPNGLKGFLAEMYGDRADFWTIGVASDEEVEAMIAKRFSVNATEKSRELLERAVQRAASGTGERGIREDFMLGLYAEQRKLLGAVQQYDQLVQIDRKEIEANLRDLDDAIRKLEGMRDEFDSKRAKK